MRDHTTEHPANRMRSFDASSRAKAAGTNCWVHAAGAAIPQTVTCEQLSILTISLRISMIHSG
jgi:hypothetical protein